MLLGFLLSGCVLNLQGAGQLVDASVGLLKGFLQFGDLGALFVQSFLASVQLPLGLLLQKIVLALQSLLSVQQPIEHLGAGLVAVLHKKDRKSVV